MLFDAISQVELFVTVFASVYALALVVYVLLSWFRVPSTLQVFPDLGKLWSTVRSGQLVAA